MMSTARAGGGDVRRARGGAEHVRAGPVLDEVHRLAVAADEPADAGQALAERAHDQVDVLLEAEVLGRPAAALAEHADAVGVVDHDGRLELLGDGDDLRERADVALHRVDAVDDDEPADGRLAGAASASPAIIRRRSAAELWLNLRISPSPSRAPSMMQAWSCLSR